jgi:hypothetical protein
MHPFPFFAYQRGLLHLCCFAPHRNASERCYQSASESFSESDRSSPIQLPKADYRDTLEVLFEARTFDMSANEILVDKIEHDKLKGATPLHTLVEDWPSNKEIDLGSLRTLLINGADPNAMHAAERCKDPPFENDCSGLMSVLDAVCVENRFGETFNTSRAVACELLLAFGGCFTRPLDALRAICRDGDYVKIVKAIVESPIYEDECCRVGGNEHLFPALEASAHGHTGLVTYFLSQNLKFDDPVQYEAPSCISEQPWWPDLEKIHGGISCVDAATVTGNVAVLRLFLSLYDFKALPGMVKQWDLLRKATIAGAADSISFLKELVASKGKNMRASVSDGEGLFRMCAPTLLEDGRIVATSEEDCALFLEDLVASSCAEAKETTNNCFVPRQRRTVHKCAQCGEAKSLTKCGRCQSVRYCGRLCQKKAWPSHKKECKVICDRENDQAALKRSQAASKKSEATLEEVRRYEYIYL